MKKFGKFLVTTFSLAALIGGAYYFYQNVMKKNEDNLDDFDDFDDFDDLNYSDEDESDTSNSEKATREYVTLNINAMKDAEEEAAKKAEQELNQDEEEDTDIVDSTSDVTEDEE